MYVYYAHSCFIVDAQQNKARKAYIITLIPHFPTYVVRMERCKKELAMANCKQAGEEKKNKGDKY